MTRRIIQISATATGYRDAFNGAGDLHEIVALCDDGSLWYSLDLVPGDSPTAWKRLPEVPQHD